MNNKPKSKTILEELNGKDSESSVSLTEVNDHQLLVHRDKESFVVVGGLFVNQNVSLVWEKSQKILKQISITTMKQSKMKMPHFGKRQ